MASTMARRQKQPAGFPLLDHLDELMAKLHEHVPAALERFDAEAVHDARVATRRLKAALDLMSPVLSKSHAKPLADGLKRLRRRLGPLRDADVMLDHLAELPGDGKHAAAAHWLRERLHAKREKLRDESRAEGSARRALRRIEGWPIVRKEIEEAREAVDCLLAESLHLQTDAFAEQAGWLVEDLAAETPAAVEETKEN
jgi:CHAD domain-containing protein